MANISYGVNILPKTNNAYTLGNSDYKWANIFTNKINGTDVTSIIAGGESGGEGSSIDVSDKVDKAALLDAGVTNSTYSTAFGGTFTVTTATDANNTVPYAKASVTGTIDKYKRFRVTINDTEYVMESGIWFISNKYYNYLGNLTKIYDHAAWIPGGIIDVPFLITFDRDNNSSIEVWTTTAGIYTIKIETITDTFKKLPSELIYGSAYPPILQCKNEGSTFSGYSLGVNILRDRRGTMAFGYGNELVADFALAIGAAHSISGESATAIGFNNSIHSNLDTSLGVQNIMYGSSPYSTTVGMGNTIYNNSSYSGTFGYVNTIEPYSQYGYAVGYWNINDGENSYSFGYSNCAFSDYTTNLGIITTTTSKYQLALGTYNVAETTTAWVASTSYDVGDIVYKNNRWYKCKTANSDDTFTSSKWERCKSKFLEILGNGDFDATPHVRSNARATDWDGNTYIKGDVYVNCNADSSGGTKLISATDYATANDFGIVKKGSGLYITDGVIGVNTSSDTNVKEGTAGTFTPVSKQHAAVFYGLAKAAGDSTQSASSNSIGNYTSGALSAIQSMLAVPSNTNPIFTGTFSLNRAANTTIGTNSVSIGDNCTASAEDSFAEGRYTTASGYYSHAEGNYTTALGVASHAEGTVTIANHASQHVFGEYNVEDDSEAANYSRGNYVEIVGNGTASDAQSNARALDWSGNEYLKGDLYIHCNANSNSGEKVITNSNLGIFTPTFTATSGYYINNTGVKSSSQYYSMSSPIPMSEGDIISLIATGYSNSVAMISLSNEEETSFIPVVNSIDSNEHEYIYRVVNDGYYIISYKNYNATYTLTQYTKNSFYAVRERIKTIEDLNLQGLIDDEKYNPLYTNIAATMSDNGHFIQKDGTYQSASSFYISSSITIPANSLIVFNAQGYQNNVAILAQVKDNTYIPLIISEDSNEHTFSYITYDQIDVLISSNKAVTPIYSIYSSRIDTLDGRINNIENDLFAFTTMGVIGDSLASGASNYSGGVSDNPNYSWGKCIERIYGTEVILFTKGGFTTQDWLTDSTGLAALQSEKALDCYIIGLGQNDAYSLGDSYLGTISDISVGDESSNADSYYGNYSKIIAAIQTKSPNAKIFCLTNAKPTSQTKLNYNSAIEDIVELYDNTYLVDLAADPFYSSSIFNNTWYGAHSTPTGYRLIAKNIHDNICKVIRQNISDFTNILTWANTTPLSLHSLKNSIDTLSASALTDVQINGTSIVSNGVATIPLASTYQNAENPGNPGLVHPSADYGTKIQDNVLAISGATESDVKTGTTTRRPLTPLLSKNIAFYGLAKAAGDTTQASSNNNIGYYTDTAKAKIQQMLGIQAQAWELIKEDTFTNATEDSHTITTDSSGNPFALTDVFFMFETPKVANAAAAKGTYGQIHFYYDTNSYFASESGAWTQEANGSAHGCMVWITQELGGLFIIRYTASTTTSNGAQWRTRYGGGFTGSSQGAQFFDSNKVISKIVIPTVTGTGHYKLYGKRQITL